jgi:threonine dehydratase
MTEPSALPGFACVQAAHARIRPWIHRTGLIRSTTLDRMVGAELFFKAEHLQKTGAFKARGACNAVMGLDEQSARAGVATHSSGNHGAALAWAARLRGIAAHVVVPSNASAAKRANILRYGARIIDCEPTQAAREAMLAEVLAATGAGYVPPYDDARVICGQGTAVLEMLQEIPDLDIVMSPVGGGGLLAGSAIAAHGIDASIRVLAAEPLGADDAARSFSAGQRLPQTDPRTIADGLRTSLGELNFRVMQRELSAVLTVDDAQIVSAMRLFWELTKQIIEPSSATVLAAALANPGIFRGKRAGLVLSGGNVDLEQLPW